MPFDKMEKETLSVKIINEIEKMIQSGEIKPGSVLPSERELSSLLGISRPPIREALHALRAIGIIDIKAGGRAYLRDNVKFVREHFKTKAMLARYTANDLIESRIIIEKETAALACVRATEDDIEKIKEANERLKAVDESEIEKYIKLDYNLHLSIAESAHNFVLTEMFETMRNLIFETNVYNMLEPSHIEKNLEMHNKICSAIINKEQETARLYMEEHIMSTLSGINYILSN